MRSATVIISVPLETEFAPTTISPTSMFLLRTVPDVGEKMVVFFRLSVLVSIFVMTFRTVLDLRSSVVFTWS